MDGYHYYDGPSKIPSQIFLAECPLKKKRSISFCFSSSRGSCPPTDYHGDWELKEKGLHTLYLTFNGRGPFYNDNPDTPRRLKGVLLHRLASHVFGGMNQGRELRMVRFVSLKVQKDGTVKDNIACSADDEWCKEMEFCVVPQKKYIVDETINESITNVDEVSEQ